MPERTPALAGTPRHVLIPLAMVAGWGLLTALLPTPAGAVAEAEGVAPDSAPVASALAPTIDLDASLRPARRESGEATFRRVPAPFALQVDGRPVPHAVLAVAALPGAEMRLEVGDPDAGGTYRLRHDAGQAVDEAQADHLAWRWTAPLEPGIHALEVVDGSGEGVRVNVLVLHPRSHVENDALHGFRIGRYAEKPLGGRSVYLPPAGFVQVGPGDEDVLVSPHFTLGQFLSKQAGEPRFVAFSPELVLKLEAVLEAVNEAGIDTGSFHVMSGFRTPWYNQAIGNTTIYSRHLWGDAADIFVDRDGNGDMDDLNGDGRRDVADARVLAGIVESVERGGAGGVLPGGLGVYRRNAAHGPFVHVDARGYAARW